MVPLHIRCYQPNTAPKPHTFYILAKGENSGKPAFNPWANSFMAISQNQEMFEFYFWLTYGLWKADKFRLYQRGSVIPFINVDDVRSVVTGIAPSIFDQWKKFQEIISYLSRLEKRKATLAEQIIVTERLQQQLFRSFFNQ